MQLGYARTSTTDQAAGLADQQAKLTAAGCERVYVEQASAAEGRERPQLDALLGFLRQGDALVVARLDRLARSTLDLLGVVKRLDADGVALRVLDLGGADVDTRSPAGRMIITMLGAIAEMERGLMLDRQRAGVAAARADGKYVGRQPTARRQSAEVLRLRDAGNDAAAIARQLGISRRSVWRIISGAEATAPAA